MTVANHTNEELYSIGKMARLCGITAKQLRYYDDNNILSPAVRDPDTGYRYYSSRQMEEVLLIKELRRIGVSLQSIVALINNRDLKYMRDELEKSIREAQQTVADAQLKYDQTIEALLRVTKAIELAAGQGNNSITLLEVPPRNVVFTRYRYYWNASTSFLARRTELYSIADRYNLSITGPNMAIFHGDGNYLDQFSDDPAKHEGDLETFFTISNSAVACPYVRSVPQFSAVSSIFVGHYRFMQPQYEAMEQWAAMHDYELSGEAIEEYIAGATMTNNADNYVTRIYLPLKGSQI